MEQDFNLTDNNNQPVVQTDGDLRKEFIEPPFTVLDARSSFWTERKKWWQSVGIKGEIGRHAEVFRMATENGKKISVFDPVLAECMYHWFCPQGGRILDPFAGGDTRGIVAVKKGFHYLGIDISEEQIAWNRASVENIFGGACSDIGYICGDSNKILDNLHMEFDMLFSCPPYASMERYSKKEDDISNMPYAKFLEVFKSILEKGCRLLKPNSFAVLVVGDLRGGMSEFYADYKNKDALLGFVPDTYNVMKSIGMEYYNEAVLITPCGTAPMRARGNMATKKLVKVHQNVLVFRKVVQ